MDSGGSRPRKGGECGGEERKAIHSGVPKGAVLWPLEEGLEQERPSHPTLLAKHLGVVKVALPLSPRGV